MFTIKIQQFPIGIQQSQKRITDPVFKKEKL